MSSCVTLAQEYILNIQHFGAEEGLSHRDVQSIHQDQQDLLWLGTAYGLNRFDGYQFKWYTKEIHGLQSNRITYIMEDAQGLLWLFDTEANFSYEIRTVDIFDPRRERSVSFEDFFADQLPFALVDVLAFTNNGSGSLAFLTNDRQVHIYDGAWRQFAVEGHPFTVVFEIRWAENDWIWLSTDVAGQTRTQNRMLQAFDLSGRQVQQARYDEFDALQIRELDTDGTCHYSICKKGTNEVQLLALSPAKEPVVDNKIDNPWLEEFLKNSPFEQAWPHPYLKKGSNYLYSYGVNLILFTEDGQITAEQDIELSKLEDSA